MQTVLDIETTYQGTWGRDDSDPSPYNPLNKLVSIGYKTTTGIQDYLMFNHVEVDPAIIAINFRKFQKILDNSDMIVGHNLKFDMSWLLEAGFTFNGRYFDTMIFEYINAMGLKVPLSLSETLKRRGLEDKLDILDEYCGKQRLNVNQVPLKELIRYGKQDIESTFQLYLKQKDVLKTDTIMAAQIAPLKLMNEFLPVLIDVERNGVKVDKEALDKVEEEFKAKHKELEAKLTTILQQVMGHTPINLNSPEHMSQVVYSLKVINKNMWADTFNLGTEVRNGVVKTKYPPRFKDGDFRGFIKLGTTTVYKTRAEQCGTCQGKGYVQLLCKDGSPRKNLNICKTCDKAGILYKILPEVAGFKIKPISSIYASSGGFSTSKDTLDDLLLTHISKEAKDFLLMLKEYNAISTYLSSFVEGIRKNVEENWILHTKFNQCVTATGRLSSTAPNLQNQPREKTFPIRRVFISRFEGGKILDVDWSGLEFRTAVALAKDPQGKADIESKADVHQFTADTMTKYGQPMSRQDAKSRTFKPLFAGMSGTEAEIKYYEEFNKKYNVIHAWQESLCTHALEHKYIKSPSGRCYAFPNIERLRNGSVSFKTQIYNYIIQGFATGDLMPCTLIDIYHALKGYKSKLVLTVHDSVIIDVHPDEMDIVPKLMAKCFNNIDKHLKDRFNFESIVPFAYEMKIGTNWLNGEKFTFS